MIISRTPFRISFFGGGTDYPVWYGKHGGAVLSTTIDKYCYITCRWLPPFFPHKHRIVYSRMENVREIDEIEHPAVREVLRYLDIDRGLEIHHDGDLPARSGLGSSSAFTVGLLHTIYALQGKMMGKRQLATQAIHVEQNLIGENVGSQDQVAAAYGGMNLIRFQSDGDIDVQPVILPEQRKNDLQDRVMFFFTGFSRMASQIAAKQIENTPKKETELHRMREMVDQALSILSDEEVPLEDFGKLLHKAWQIKRSLSDSVTNPAIDAFYNKAMEAGASGGKLIGAGGGGFMLFLVEPENREAVRQALSNLLYVPVKFETGGSRIMVYEP